MPLTDTSIAEQQRINALHQLEMLDTEPEPEFDELVRLAAAICGVPISALSLVDEDRQWFKASEGLTVKSTPREWAFCDHTIRQSDLLLVEDAQADPRFVDNPLVTGDTKIRFYAGVPITDTAGLPVGALCVIDQRPRTLNQQQREALRVLASQVNARIDLRVKRRELEQALAEAKAATARLTASENRFQAFMDSGPFMAFLKDADGRLLYYNEKVALHYKVTRTFLLNKTEAELWSPSLAHLYRTQDLETLSSGKPQIVERESPNPDGSISTIRSYKFPCTDEKGRVLLGGISIDVTAELQRETDLKRSQDELEVANRQLRELASIDSLTELANRRVFDEQFRIAFRRARRTGAPLCVLMIDVDHFKTQNDRFGHAHGDQVLRTLAKILKGKLRAGDLFARYGGEEFVILLAETEEDKARMLAARLLEAIRDHQWPLDPVTISIGVSALDHAIPDTHHLLTRADQALYAAKCSGRDRAVAYADVYSQTLPAAHTNPQTQSPAA